MNIIEATISDLSQLTAMNIQLRHAEKADTAMTPHQVNKRMHQFICAKNIRIYLLKQKENILGYALINTARQPLYLRQLFIKEAYRRRGYGVFLLTEILKKYESETFDVDVMVWNEDAIRFYENFGFKQRFISLRLSKTE